MEYINAEWIRTSDGPKVKYLLRNKKFKLKDLPFDPYFYIKKRDLEDAKYYLSKTKIPFEIEKVPAITADDREFVVKVSTVFPSDVKKLRLELEANGIMTYEADIPYVRRMQIDLNKHLAKPEKILFFDIEVDARSKFSDPELAENRIISIAAVDHKGKEFFFSEDNESNMIIDFFDLAQKYELLVAWNANFDVTYLSNRAKKLGIFIGHVTKKGDNTFIFEHPHTDLQKIFKNIFKRKVRSYALKAVARDFLGKEDVIEIETRDDMLKLWNSFITDKKLLKEYNLQDCWLMKELDDEVPLLEIQYTITKITSMETYFPRGMSTYVDSLHLKVAREEEPLIVFRTKRKHSEEEEEEDDEERYRGGLVKDPEYGLHKNVAVLDLKCFTEDHYVLTPDGFKKITDFKVGDLVYTLNPDTFEVEVSKVVKVHKYRYKGKIFKIENDNIDVKVTPNHRFYVSRDSGRSFRFIEIRDFDLNATYILPRDDLEIVKNVQTIRTYNDLKIEDFDGYVYCITTDKNHIILAGRNGKFCWIGQSTYPSIVRTFNVGIETWRTQKTAGILAPHGSFILSKQSIASKICERLQHLRDEAKSVRNQFDPNSVEYKIWDGVQFGYKFLINSVYGYYGFSDSRCFLLEVAENITLYCRACMKQIIDYLSKKNYIKILYYDSVHPSVCIPMIVDGILYVEPIKEMWNLLSKRFKSTTRWDGKEEMKLENVYTFTRKGIRKVNRLIRHKCNKKCLLVRARPGAPFVTEDHSLIVNGKEVSPRELVEKNLEPDTIENLSWKPEKIIDKIDVLDYIDYENFEIVEVTNDTIILQSKSRKKTKYKIPRFIKLDYKTGYVFGAYISEGSILGKGSVRLIGTRDIEFCNKVYRYAEEIFGKENVTLVNTNRHVHVKKVFRKLFEDILGIGAENKRIPWFFFNAPKEFQKGLVDAYLKGDGSTLYYGWKFGTISRTLASQLSFYFVLQGHNARCTVTLRRKGESLPKGYKRREDLITYQVNIFKDNLIRENSPFKNVRKNEIIYEETPEYVYDLEVEDDHTFIDALGCIVCHNTDGVMIKFPENYTIEEVERESEKLREEINQMLKKWIYIEFGVPEDRILMEIKVDRIADTAYFPNKKKSYVFHVVREDGKPVDYIHIKGFECVRSNFPLLCRELQKKVLEYVVLEKPFSEIEKLIQEYKELLFSGKVDDKLVLYVTLRKDPKDYKRKTRHAIIAEKLKEMGIQVAIGDKIAMIDTGEEYIPYIPGKTKLTEKQYRDFWNNRVIAILEGTDLPYSWRDFSVQKTLFDF